MFSDTCLSVHGDGYLWSHVVSRGYLSYQVPSMEAGYVQGMNEYVQRIGMSGGGYVQGEYVGGGGG